MSVKGIVRSVVLSTVGWPNFLRRLQWFPIGELLAPIRGEIIVDLGAGPLQYSFALSKMSEAKVIAVDLAFSDEVLAEARRRGLTILCADAMALPFATATVDKILISSLLHMVPRPEVLLTECRRILKPQGYIVLSVPNNYQYMPKILGWSSWRHISKWLGLPKSYEELQSALNRKFKVGGPQGYYSFRELEALLARGGFEVVVSAYAPARAGSFLWELAVLTHLKLGNVAFHFLFLVYPFVRLVERSSRKPSTGSEHIVKAVSHGEH